MTSTRKPPPDTCTCGHSWSRHDRVLGGNKGCLAGWGLGPSGCMCEDFHSAETVEEMAARTGWPVELLNARVVFKADPS